MTAIGYVIICAENTPALATSKLFLNYEEAEEYVNNAEPYAGNRDYYQINSVLIDFDELDKVQR